MKQRLLVMNGQRLVQSEQEGRWNTDKVEKAGAVKPGIYNIYLSVQADKTKVYDGMVFFIDKAHVYQKVGKDFVKHERKNFDNSLDIRGQSRIKYEDGKAVISELVAKLECKIA
jgi:KfrB protein